MVKTKYKPKTEEDRKDREEYMRWKHKRDNPELYKKMNTDYYEKHKDKIKETRNSKYKTDEKYREAQKKRSQENFKKNYVPSTRKIMTPEEKKVAQKKAMTKYNAINRKERNAARRARYWKNRDKEIATSMKNRNPKRQNELQKKRYNEREDVREKQLQMNRNYYARNTEKFAEYQKIYRNTEKGKAIRAVCEHNRRALKKAAGSFKWQDWLVLRNASPLCNMCGRFVGCDMMTIDHKIPLSKKGPNKIENIQPLCLSCNCSKNDFVREEVMRDFLMMTMENRG